MWPSLCLCALCVFVFPTYFTVTTISVVFDSAPSLAVARRRYVPGSAKRAVVTAFPLVTEIGPICSNATFPGPPTCSHLTFRPLGAPLPTLLDCAPKPPAVGRGVLTGRGLGRPSSVTETVSVTGTPT